MCLLFSVHNMSPTPPALYTSGKRTGFSYLHGQWLNDYEGATSKYRKGVLCEGFDLFVCLFDGVKYQKGIK